MALAVLAVGLIVTGIAAGYLATKYLVGHFAPSFSHVPAEYGVRAEAVSFRSPDGIELRGWWIPANRGRPARGTVILAHGLNSNRSGMLSHAIFLAAHGYNAFPIDLRAHGESSGEFVASGYLDLLGAVAAAKRRGERGPFILLGHSYGARASLWAAAQSHEIAAVIADSANRSIYISTKRWAVRARTDAGLSRMRKVEIGVADFLVDSSWAKAFIASAYRLRTGTRPPALDLDVTSAVSQIGNRPILFIAAEHDPVATPEDARYLYAAAQSPAKAILILPNAGHFSTYENDPRLYEAKVLEFLTAALAPRGERTEGARVKKTAPIAR